VRGDVRDGPGLASIVAGNCRNNAAGIQVMALGVGVLSYCSAVRNAREPLGT
jgi:hypothetical protein